MTIDMDSIIRRIIERVPLSVPNDVRYIIAIDGRCASGKTTLAERLRERLGCAVFHTDDYFPRADARHTKACWNVDYERIAEEILDPLRKGVPKVTYRPFDCHEQKLLPPVTETVSSFAVVEGSYSCHPALWQKYDLHIFLTVDPERQLCRLIERNGESVPIFAERWIPMEEKYFQETSVQSRCELCFET